MRDLTAKQREVVRLIDQGLSREEIAVELDVSVSNVRETVRRLCERFGCRAHQLPFVALDGGDRTE